MLVCIRVAMAPFPVFPLLIAFQVTKLSIGSVVFGNPLPVINVFTVIPHMIVTVVAVIDPVVDARRASGNDHHR